MKATVKRNRYGNWRGYIGGKFEREFAHEPGTLVGNMQNLGDMGGSGTEMPAAAAEWLAANNEPTTTTIHLTYFEWESKDGRGSFVKCDPEEPPIKLPARITKLSYIVKYGGVDREAMERGEGHSQKILPRFSRRGIHRGQPRFSWREYFGHHTMKKMLFELPQP